MRRRNDGGAGRRRSFTATRTVGIFAAVASVALAGCGSNGLSRAQPTRAQLQAMATFYVRQDGRSTWGSDTHLGCVVTSMAIHRAPEDRLISYSQTLCQGCPISDGQSGIYPTVYTLKGDEVVSVKQADAPGDPMWSNQIKRLFPRSLWYDAGAQDIPHVAEVSRRATALAECRSGR